MISPQSLPPWFFLAFQGFRGGTGFGSGRGWGGFEGAWFESGAGGSSCGSGGRGV